MSYNIYIIKSAQFVDRFIDQADKGSGQLFDRMGYLAASSEVAGNIVIQDRTDNQTQQMYIWVKRHESYSDLFPKFTLKIDDKEFHAVSIPQAKLIIQSAILKTAMYFEPVYQAHGRVQSKLIADGIYQ